MKIKNRFGLAVLSILLFTSPATAQPQSTKSPQILPSSIILTQQQQELAKLQQEKKVIMT